ncbi:hypothetical protein [Mesorhizobium sp.]|uniref:hypothetical protein n=2 Tax=unclassified Mesorhizobium TaxID=325217 RepID=UPI00257F9D90|nr:hypothetical protein [Mesorhizobium sp.]
MTPKNRNQFSEHGSAAGLRCGTDLRKNQRIMRKIAAIAAAADEEGAAGGSPQPLADMIEFSQQLMICVAGIVPSRAALWAARSS